ncbi:uncharacterized protein LOC131948376 [Physella acuta]|uniref:uncharacterized protein LOC131948376 n=1 Tax=Physella acuta TaxID=109671 RepID=UPI0027DDE630|nr:uncharacterized protein LOC131948376 [Physella acuta]XP_059165965.1 uncharacterized protein LOC131948376 [Physella acuta]
MCLKNTIVLLSCCSFILSQLTANAEAKSNSTGGLVDKPSNQEGPENITNNSSNQPQLSKTFKLSSNKTARSLNHVPRFTPGNESLCFVVRFFSRNSDDNFLKINRLENIMSTLSHSHEEKSHLRDPSQNLDNHNQEHVEENDSHHNEIPAMLIRNTTTDNYVSLSDPGNFSRNTNNSKKHHIEEDASSVMMPLLRGSNIQISDATTCDSLKQAFHKPEDRKCLSIEELLSLFRFENLKSFSQNEFLQLCPAIFDQVESGYCGDSHAHEGDSHAHNGESHAHNGDSHANNGDSHAHEGDSHAHNGDSHANNGESHAHDGDPHLHEGTSHLHDGGDTHTHDGDSHSEEVASPKAWGCTMLSVCLLSICSVAGAVVIPNMKKVFYNHVLQFLVAVAVGAMCGDAMLHLLPHALMSESHHASHHHTFPETNNRGSNYNRLPVLYKGLVALVGIYLFFFMERLLTILTKRHSTKKSMKNKIKKRSEGCDGSSTMMTRLDTIKDELPIYPSCDDVVMVVHPNKALKEYADASHEAHLHSCDESLNPSASGHDVTAVTSRTDVCMLVPSAKRKQCRVELPDSETDPEIKVSETFPVNHAHSHLNVSSRTCINSVVLIVIIGDMIHNMCDGLVIGTAFGGSIAGGISTSLAVFCHELPHEIGDFAVLVRSGLTIRKAMFFNFLATIPKFLGAVIGLTLGSQSSASLWIFAMAGGMFLYVTLVDLLPEMTFVYTKSGEPWFLHLLLQATGITLGTTIVLIISVSEESSLTS